MYLLLTLLPILFFATPITSAPLTLAQGTNIVEIHQITNLYAIALDQHQLGLLPLIFTPDVVVDFNVPGRPIINGISDLSEQIRGMCFFLDLLLTGFPLLDYAFRYTCVLEGALN